MERGADLVRSGAIYRACCPTAMSDFGEGNDKMLYYM
jgi:hypothetical protein